MIIGKMNFDASPSKSIFKGAASIALLKVLANLDEELASSQNADSSTRFKPQKGLGIYLINSKIQFHRIWASQFR